MLPTPGLLSWSHWPWWEGKRCPGSEVLGLMPWASSTGLLAFWTGTSVFLTYRDPKWWDFCNELLPNTQGLKDTEFTFLNPTKADSKPPVSMMRSPALAVFFTTLLSWALVVPEPRRSLVYGSSRPVRSVCPLLSQCWQHPPPGHLCNGLHLVSCHHPRAPTARS